MAQANDSSPVDARPVNPRAPTDAPETPGLAAFNAEPVLTKERPDSDTSSTEFIEKSGDYDKSDYPPLATDLITENNAKVFSRTKHDPDAVATQPSAFEELNGVELHGPPPSYENAHRFDPYFRWTWREDRAATWKVDTRIFLWTGLMFFSLEIDRSNIQQANSQGFLQSLGMTTADYNLGNTLFRVGFLVAEMPAQIISKAVGPDRFIPIQMVLWSIVSISQYWLSGRSSFLATRFLLALCQGGFIPDNILLLSFYYTNYQLPIRLAWFWVTNYLADIVSAFLAIPILQLDGHNGKEGWRYLFLLEGLFTLLVGIASFWMMPPGPTQTRNRFRKNGYFTEREEKIIVNRILRDSPTKSSMHNRQALSYRQFYDAFADYYLWPLYLIGILFGIPTGPINSYFTLILRQLGFSTTATNALTVPSSVLTIILLVGLTYLSERFKRRALLASIQDLWIVPLLIALLTFTEQTNRWAKFAVSALAVGHPYSHAIQVAWVSRNANGVATRTVSAAIYNITVQLSAIIYSNVYQPGDAPLYKKGNAALLAIAVFTLCLYVFTYFFYSRINARRAKIWDAWSPEERNEYLCTTKDHGSRLLNFRFAT